MTASPRLSVLMTVYNAGAFLRAAVDSVLSQTYTDFELVLIDDASTDGSLDVLRGFPDPRIVLHPNAQNIGQTASLNIGLGLCRGEYIARMDADDLCRPDRFARQVAFLDAHPDVGILGGAIQAVDGAGRRIERVRQPRGDLAIRWLSMTRNPFHHPAVMLRRSVLDQHTLRFDTSWGANANQDYELWDRILQVTRAANLPDIVLDYRIHGANMSVVRIAENHRNSLIIGLRRVSMETGLDFPEATLAGIYEAMQGSPPVDGIPAATPADALDGFLDLTGRFLERHAGSDLDETRRWATGMAMKTWLARPMAGKRGRLLGRILGISAAAPMHTAALYGPIAVDMLRGRLAGR